MRPRYAALRCRPNRHREGCEKLVGVYVPNGFRRVGKRDCAGLCVRETIPTTLIGQSLVLSLKRWQKHKRLVVYPMTKLPLWVSGIDNFRMPDAKIAGEGHFGGPRIARARATGTAAPGGRYAPQRGRLQFSLVRYLYTASVVIRGLMYHYRSERRGELMYHYRSTPMYHYRSASFDQPVPKRFVFCG